MPITASRVDKQRNRVGIGPERVTNVSHVLIVFVIAHEQVTSTDFPGHYPGEDHSWNLEHFQKTFRVKIIRNTDDEMEFDLMGLDASIANAFRRILIAEVPTMAIEHVYVTNNTSIIQDEVLAHRLGLVPIKADPGQFDYQDASGSPLDTDTIVFTLSAKCTRNPSADPAATDARDKYINAEVYSSALVWQPKGDQEERFAEDPCRPVNPNILLAKLRPGQEIEMELHAVKGIGKDHAKFSPVATASYRLMPEITIKQDITGDDAVKFAECFPKGVVKVQGKNKKAVVVDPRKDTVSREVLRHKEFADKVELSRIRDHFIFDVESTGIVPAFDLFRSSVSILKDKCSIVKAAMEKTLADR